MLSLSSSQCLGLACNVLLWYFLIILTFFVFYQALHQATRLENLVQLFNVERHAIGIKPVHGLDDAIAKCVLPNLFKEMDMCIFLIILTQNDSYSCHEIILLC